MRKVQKKGQHYRGFSKFYCLIDWADPKWHTSTIPNTVTVGAAEKDDQSCVSFASLVAQE